MSDEEQRRELDELRDELISEKIRLEQAAKRQGMEAQPVPWADLARQCTALERVTIRALAGIHARAVADPDADVSGWVAAFEERIRAELEKEQVRVELEATTATLRELIRIELAGGPATQIRPRLIT